MNYYDEEVKGILGRLENIQQVNIEKNIQKYFNLIETRFSFSGGKIDWSKTKNHTCKKIEHILEFANEIIESLLKQFWPELEIIHLGDSLTEYAYKFFLCDMNTLIPAFIEIPEHHYFIPIDASWCFTITMEGDIDFGFAIH